MQAHQQAAGVGQVARQERCRRTGRSAKAWYRHTAGVEVALGLDDRGRVGAAHVGDDGIAAVEAISLAQAALQHHANAQQIAQEEAVGLHEHALAVRVGQARDWRGAQQAV